MQRDDGGTCLRAAHDVISNLVGLRRQIRILGLARHAAGWRNRNDYFRDISRLRFDPGNKGSVLLGVESCTIMLNAPTPLIRHLPIRG